MRVIYGIVTLALAASCGTPTQPAVPATVQADLAAVTAVVRHHNGTKSLSFVVPVTITNAGAEPLLVADCSHAIEQPGGADWMTVWRPNCLGGSVMHIVIPAGGTSAVEFNVWAYLSASGSPQWEADAVGGTYRLRIGFMPPGGSGAIPTIVSNPFVLVEP